MHSVFILVLKIDKCLCSIIHCLLCLQCKCDSFIDRILRPWFNSVGQSIRPISLRHGFARAYLLVDGLFRCRFSVPPPATIWVGQKYGPFVIFRLRGTRGCSLSSAAPSTATRLSSVLLCSVKFGHRLSAIGRPPSGPPAATRRLTSNGTHLPLHWCLLCLSLETCHTLPHASWAGWITSSMAMLTPTSQERER